MLKAISIWMLLVSAGVFAQPFSSINAGKLCVTDSCLTSALRSLRPCDDNVFTGYNDCDRACEAVADIYFERKDYRKAIFYYDSLTFNEKYGTRDPGCYGAFLSWYVPILMKKTECYEKLDRYQDAIIDLTPYYFHSFSGFCFDSSTLKKYTSVLLHLNSSDKILDELDEAIKNFYYENKLTGTGEFSITCYLSIFGQKLDYSRSNNYRNMFTRDFIAQLIERLPIVNYLRGTLKRSDNKL